MQKRKILFLIIISVAVFVIVVISIAFLFVGELKNTSPANLKTDIVVKEIPYYSSVNGMFGGNAPENLTFPSNLYIAGSVTNTGGDKAFDAGLHVIAYATNGTLEINMTVPFKNGATVFGTDPQSAVYVSTYYKDYLSSLQLGNLESGQTIDFEISLYHEGIVSNWSTTAQWAYSKTS